MIRKRTVETLKVNVHTTKADISTAGINGCRDATKCMEKVAITRALSEAPFRIPPYKSKVRIDAGSIRFNYDGSRWAASTPKVPKKALIVYDRITTSLKRKKPTSEEFDKSVAEVIGPHSYSFVAQRGSKLRALTRERMDQINLARRIRDAKNKAEGKKVTRYTLRDRVVGHR